MKKYKLISILGFVLAFQTASAVTDWVPQQTNYDKQNVEIIKHFQNFSDVVSQKITTPAVFEIGIDQNNQNEVAIFEVTDKKFVPHKVSSYNISNVPISASISQKNPSQNFQRDDYVKMFDGDANTYLSFENNSIDHAETTTIVFTYKEPVDSDALTIIFDNNVSYPDTVSLSAEVKGKQINVLNNVGMNTNTINFPKTRSTKWTLILTHSQFLRISEVSLNGDPRPRQNVSVSFLALPNHQYKLYSNPESQVHNYADYEEAGSLTTSNIVVSASINSTMANPSFVPIDSDNDGIKDSTDNCPTVSNALQTDQNKNGIGDDCEDYDHDGVINSVDNCIDVPNYNQKDTDGDKIGDACDTDESRITEKYPFIVWVGLALATFVFGALLVLATKSKSEQVAIESEPKI